MGKLFESIIDEATTSKAAMNKAAENKEHAPKSDGDKQQSDSIFYFEPESSKNDKVFTRFVRKSVDYYSAKKTLLYAEKPRPISNVWPECVTRNLR